MPQGILPHQRERSTGTDSPQVAQQNEQLKAEADSPGSCGLCPSPSKAALRPRSPQKPSGTWTLWVFEDTHFGLTGNHKEPAILLFVLRQTAWVWEEQHCTLLLLLESTGHFGNQGYGLELSQVNPLKSAECSSAPHRDPKQMAVQSQCN